MRVAVLNGVNLDVLGRRDPALYGGLGLAELESRIYDWARELELSVQCRQTNSEAEFVKWCHDAHDNADSNAHPHTDADSNFDSNEYANRHSHALYTCVHQREFHLRRRREESKIGHEHEQRFYNNVFCGQSLRSDQRHGDEILRSLWRQRRHRLTTNRHAPSLYSLLSTL